MRSLVYMFCLSLFVFLFSCNDCAKKGLIGPGFLQSTIDDYNLFAQEDTLIFQNFDGDLKKFIRIFPEKKTMQVRTDYRSVSCVENDNRNVLLSSQLERIDNIFTTEDEDTISVGLKIINFGVFDPFVFDERELTSFPVYLTIDVVLSNPIRRQVGMSGYIAYSNNRENEVPEEWDNIGVVDIRTPTGPDIESTYKFTRGSGNIYYKKDQGLVGWSLFDDSDWRIVQ